MTDHPIKAMRDELAALVAKVSSPNGWDWMFPIRVVPVDGKPTIASQKGGNLFRGYIATWQEADLLVALANAAPQILSYLSLATGWRCFHCGEHFTSEHSARLHFGRDEVSEPACIIKAGAEGSLLKALRQAEEAADDAIQAMHAESTDAAKAYHAQRCRHSQALTAAEELGYERGLADGRALATPSAPQSADAPITESDIPY